MALSDERKESIDRFLDDHLTTVSGDRVVIEVLRSVLAGLSDDEFQDVTEKEPVHIQICDAYFHFRKPFPKGLPQGSAYNIVCFLRKLNAEPVEYIRYTVSHEFAHLYSAVTKGAVDPLSTEYEACEIAIRWGYGVETMAEIDRLLSRHPDRKGLSRGWVHCLDRADELRKLAGTPKPFIRSRDRKSRTRKH